MENKKVKVEFEGSDLILKLDMNQDGEAVMEMKLKLVELLDEIGYIVKPKE